MNANAINNVPMHTVVSLPYYPIQLREKIISKLIQKSKVVYQTVCQYCKPYLKYWPQGINDPLDPSGGQKIQCFIKWKGLLVSGGVYNRVQINSILKINILNPFTYSLRDQKIFFGILLCALVHSLPDQLIFICTGFCILESKTPLKLILDGLVSDQFYLKDEKSFISVQNSNS